MEDGHMNGEVLGEEEIGELRLDDDVLNPSGGGYDDELLIREDGDYLSDRRSGGGNSDILTPAGSVSSGEGLATASSTARADSIPFEREMSIDDEITMETTDPITEEDPPSIASEIESVPRDAHEEEEEDSQRLMRRRFPGTGSGVNTSMDMRSAASASRSSYRPTSPTVKDMINSYLYRDRDTDPYDLLLDVPDIEVDTDSSEYEYDYEPVSDGDRGVNNLLTALEDQIKWKSNRNMKKATGTFDEPRNTLISRYNPQYEPPPETYEPRTVPRSVPTTSSSTLDRSKRRSSLDTTTRDIGNRYLAPLNKKLSSSYDSLPRYVPSSTSSSSSSGYSSIGRYGSVDSLSPSRAYRSRSEEPTSSSYLSKPSYSSGLGYRSYSSSDVSRITPSYRASYADTYSYDDDDSESESDDPYFSPLAPHRAYRAHREGQRVKGPFSKHMGRFSSTITSTSTPPRSPSTSRKNDVPIDERLRQIRENYRKNHKLDYERKEPYSYSSYAGLGVDSEGGSALSMESSEDERVVSRAKIEPVHSRRLVQQPFFSLPLRRKTVYDGEPARISCNVQGTPKPRITWSKNGIPIYDGTYYNITYRWGVAMVEIRHASKSDTGTFRCTATNAEGEATSACELVVEERLPPDETEDYIRPSFAKPLRRIRAKEGRKVRLEIQVMGWPEPKVTWMKDNVPVQHSDHMYVEKFPNGLQSLVIYRVVQTDAARYQAIASSPAGKATCSADVDVIAGEAVRDYSGDSGRGRHKTRKAPRSSRSYLDVTTESTRSHHKKSSKPLRDPLSLSPTYGYESKRTQRKDYYTPRTDVLAPSRGRSYSPTSPTGLSPSSRYSQARPYSPSTYRPSSPMGTYRPSSPTSYRSPSPAYRPSSPTYRASSPYSSYATSKRLTSRRGVEDSGVDYYQARSDRPSQYSESQDRRRTTRDAGPGYLDVTHTSASFTRSGGRPLPKLTSYTAWYDSMRANRDRPTTPTTSDRSRYTPEPYRPVVRDRPVSGPTRIPRRVYRSEEEDYYSVRDETSSPYRLDDRYNRQYGGYDVDDEEFEIRTYAPSATGVGVDDDDEEVELAAPEEQPETAGPPTFVRKFQDMSVRDGERVVLEAEITGSRPMDVGWLRNGQDIVDCKEFRYVSRGNVYQLEIAEIFPEDSGKYTCEALNDHGEAECSAMLTVNEEPSVSISISQSMDVSLSTDIPCTATIDEDHIPPEFFEEPQSQMVEEGTTAVFTCDVDGDPVPSVTWSREGRPISDGGRYSIRSDKFTHTFEVLNARSTDAGPYTCTAKNSEGEVVCEFTLDILPNGAGDHGITASDVSSPAARDSAESAKPSSAPSADEPSTAPQGSAGKGPKDGESTTGRSGSDTDSQEGSPPKFVRGLQEEVAWEEDKVVLECQVQGVPMPTVQWFVHNKEIESDKFVVLTVDDNGVCRLTISEAFPEDSGVYRCQATNSSGTAATTGELMVAAKVIVPTKPAGKPKVETTSKSSFKITWTAPAEDGGSPIFNYKVDCRKAGESAWTEVGNVSTTSFEAQGVKPGVQYVYRVSAENEAGWSPPTDLSEPTVITESEPPPKPSSGTDKPPAVKDSPPTKDQAGKGPAPKPSPAPPPKRVGGGGLAGRMAKFSK